MDITDGNWEVFAQELASNFGPHDPFGNTQISLDTLFMKPGDRLATYQLEFNTHAVMMGYNEAALFQVFYHGLPSRIKDTMVQNQFPASLAGLKALASQLDQQYHRRNTERANKRAAANPPPGKSKGKGKGGGNPTLRPRPTLQPILQPTVTWLRLPGLSRRSRMLPSSTPPANSNRRSTRGA
jgi:hypothetical protein